MVAGVEVAVGADADSDLPDVAIGSGAAEQRLADPVRALVRRRRDHHSGGRRVATGRIRPDDIEVIRKWAAGARPARRRRRAAGGPRVGCQPLAIRRPAVAGRDVVAGTAAHRLRDVRRALGDVRRRGGAVVAGRVQQPRRHCGPGATGVDLLHEQLDAAATAGAERGRTGAGDLRQERHEQSSLGVERHHVVATGSAVAGRELQCDLVGGIERPAAVERQGDREAERHRDDLRVQRIDRRVRFVAAQPGVDVGSKQGAPDSFGLLVLLGFGASEERTHGLLAGAAHRNNRGGHHQGQPTRSRPSTRADGTHSTPAVRHLSSRCHELRNPETRSKALSARLNEPYTICSPVLQRYLNKVW